MKRLLVLTGSLLFVFAVAFVVVAAQEPAPAQEPTRAGPLCYCEGANLRIELTVGGMLTAKNISRQTRGPIAVMVTYTSTGQLPGEIVTQIPRLRPGQTVTVTQVLGPGPNMLGDAQVRVSYSYVDDSCVSDWHRLTVIYFPFAYGGQPWQPTPPFEPTPMEVH